MIIPPGVLFPADVCGEIGPALLDILESKYRNDGRQVPEHVRSVVMEAAQLGDKFRALELAKDPRGVRSGVRTAALPRSAGENLKAMKTYTAAETAERLKTGRRAVQRRAGRGTLPATRRGREWCFDAVAIDRLAERSKP